MFSPPRFPLLYGPTPLHRLPRLSEELGIDLWMKRDDLTGFALGGNKGRKLEYLIPEIQASGADVVLCSGATQSNFIRQCAAACRMIGVACRAVVMDMPYDAPAGKPEYPGHSQGGNRQLSEEFGAEIIWLEDGIWEELEEAVEREAASLRAEGKSVFVIPLGGSSVLSAYSFVQAAQEVGDDFDWIVTASSSGSTHAGLAWHFAGSKTSVTGISCDPEPELYLEVARLTQELDQVMEQPKDISPEQIDMRLDWVGSGYAIPSPEGQAAFDLMLVAEGIALDPVYTTKAFAGVIAMAKSGELKGRVLFWHTGGVPILMAR